MAPPTYVGSGTFTAGSATITPPFHASTAVDDIALLVVESENQAISLSDAQGFVEVPDSPQFAGTAATNPANRIAVFWKRITTSGGGTAPTVADPGNHATGQIHTFPGCVTTGDPWDVTAGGNDGGANDTSGVIPGDTTTVADCLVVLICGTSFNGDSTAQFSAWTNSDLANVTERTDNCHTIGLGGGHGMATGEKATAGAYGNTTVTLANTSFKGALSIALKPPAGGNATVTPGVIAATVSLPAVSAQGHVSRTPGMIAATVTLPQAMPDTPTIVTPAAIGLVAAIPQAGLSAESVVTPGVLAALVSVPQAAVSAAAVVTPNTVPLVVALPQAAAGAATTATPATIAATVTLPQASLSAGAAVTPASIAAVASLPQAGVSAGASVSPGTIPVVVGIPQAVAGAAATVFPGVIGATISIPQANVTADAVASPNPVLVIVQVPQTGLSASSTVTPAVIPLVVSLPQALALTESTEFIWELLGATSIKWFTPGTSLKWETGQPEAGPTV